MNPRPLNVEYKTPYQLIVTFTNNEVKQFNLEPYLEYPVYEKLRDESYCRRVTVNHGVIVWDDETDFDPDTVYLEGLSVIAVQ